MTIGAAVDLTDVLSQDTAVFEVMRPGGIEPLGWKITFAGPAHPQTVDWANRNARRELRRTERIEAAQANGRKYKPDERDPEEIRHENAEWVVSRILGWTPVSIEGETVEFTPENAKRLLLDRRLAWVMTQCYEFLGDERSFTKGSPRP